MKLKFNYLILILNLFLLTNIFAQDFVIAKQDNSKLSRNKSAIKENIGNNIKSGLDNIADLNKTIAKIQVKTSKIQKQLTNSVQDLVEGQGNFEKKSSGDLNKSLDLIKDINSKLNEQLKIVKNIKSDLDKNVCFKELGHK